MSRPSEKWSPEDPLAGANDVRALVVFCSDIDYAVRANIRALLDEFPQARILVLEHKPRKRPTRLLRNQVRNLRKHGWRWIPEQVREVFSRLGSRGKRSVQRDRPGSEFDWTSLSSGGSVQCERLQSVNSKDAERILHRWEPFLGISLGAPILKSNVFKIPAKGTINLHKGRVPDYRGMPPAFWELHNGESTVGCTVHEVTEGLDTGGVLVTDQIPVSKYSTVASLRLLLDELGIQLICKAAREIAQGTATVATQPREGKTYTKPTLREEQSLRRRRAEIERAVTAEPGVRRVGKNSVFRAYTTLWRPAARSLRLSEQRIVVLLYHRVNDDMRDAVTVGIEQFDSQMRWIASNYPTCTLEDLIARRIPKSRRPVVTVTFDDGYLDNFLHAAPILRRHGVPAAFFISTGIVGTDRAFAHDLQKLGRRVPAMTWDQVRVMRRQGFSFGSHTVSHVNLAAVSHDVAVQELSDSRQTLRRELGLTDVAIAYPFGRTTDITPERIALIEECGYKACCSGYGGFNSPTSLDLYNIKRVGIDFKFSLPAFKARLECWPGA